MSVYKKLQQARIELQSRKLEKSGHNKFAGYEYFELGDFLPAIQDIFNELGLFGGITFKSDVAELTIVNVESVRNDGTYEAIVFTCPMATAQLKGCHEVQNLGASMTYIRRYLWVNALEIVEHDALDATTGKGVHKPTAQETYKPEGEELTFLQGIIDTINNFDDKVEAAAYLKEQNLDADEKIWVWDKLDSKTRSAIKGAK